MDIITLATTALSLATPFLIKTGEKIAEKIGEDIWNLLKNPFAKKEQESLETDIQNDSEKERIIEAIIAKINSDQQYKTELENAVNDAKKALYIYNQQNINNNNSIEKQVNIQIVTGNITL
jgi:organic radical activating enzyme